MHRQILISFEIVILTDCVKQNKFISYLKVN